MEFKAFLTGDEQYGSLESEDVPRRPTPYEEITGIEYNFASSKLEDLKFYSNKDNIVKPPVSHID